VVLSCLNLMSSVQASGTPLSIQEISTSCLETLPSLTMHIDSPPPAAIEDMHSHAESLPSFRLTLPTPEFYHSPVFAPQSPFTVDKFDEASQPMDYSAYASTSRQNTSIPSLPRCNHPGPHFCPGELCWACESQSLACKVWYQGHSSAPRRRLREPYVKLCKSKATNRAITETLGFPTCPQGLGISVMTAGPPSSELRNLPTYISQNRDQATAAGTPEDRGHTSRLTHVADRGKRILERIRGLFRRSWRILRRHVRNPAHEFDRPPTSFLPFDDNSRGRGPTRASRLWHFQKRSVS
jgi:hypothetical protein